MYTLVPSSSNCIAGHLQFTALPQMADTHAFKVIERIADLCLNVNLHLHAKYSELKIMQADVDVANGGLNLIRDFHSRESLIGGFDEEVKLASFKTKYRNAALMYRRCRASVLFFGRFIESLLNDTDRRTN